MKSKRMTTEQMVRACFCALCKDQPKGKRNKSGKLMFCKLHCPLDGNFTNLARAARRFVKMERRERINNALRISEKYTISGPDELPKNWGELRDGTKY